MESSLHDILQGLMIARGHADNIAGVIEQSDPEAAACFRRFSEKLSDIWGTYYPLFPTNQRIYMLQIFPRNKGINGQS